LASGEKPLHRELERAISDFLGCEDAIVMVGGHATNVSVLGHLFGPRDVIVHDELAHDSLLGGIGLSGAGRRSFAHNDVDDLERVLDEVRPRARRLLVAVEGVYSMDGDLAPMKAISQVSRERGALLFVDEAHSIGTVGVTGRGVGEHYGLDRADVDIWMGTLSKSLASCGGYVAGSRALIEYLKYTMPGFVYSVGISPANAAAALAAVRKLVAEPGRVAELQANAAYFIELCQERGLDTGLSRATPIIPCIVPDSTDCLRLGQALFEHGINVQPIVHPAVEENRSRLRFFVSSRHTKAQLRLAADATHEELLRLRPSRQRSFAGGD
jgi:7-keto-8-aminopelargonate synthetase-like enzyme